jgi:hypothetical protein
VLGDNFRAALSQQGGKRNADWAEVTAVVGRWDRHTNEETIAG